MQNRNRLSMALVCVCVLGLVTACSHLHMDAMDKWSPSTIDTVAYTIKGAPAAETEAEVRRQVAALGWVIVPDKAGADAVIETEFGYKTDLNSESERIRTLDSVHVRVRDAKDARTLAVSDYFYAHGRENEWEEGVAAVFTALNVNNSAQRLIDKEPVSTPTQAEETGEIISTPETTEVAPDVPSEVEPAPAKTTRKPEPQAEDAELKNVRARAAMPEAERVSEPESVREPESMEKSPWIPRFQGWGLEAWEGTE